MLRDYQPILHSVIKAYEKRASVIMDLKGRKAVVTGSAVGIGRATAESFARAGAAVVINGRGDTRAVEALHGMRKLLSAADIIGLAADLAIKEGADAFTGQALDNAIIAGLTGHRVQSNWMKAPVENKGITQTQAKQSFLQTMRPTSLGGRLTTTDRRRHLAPTAPPCASMPACCGRLPSRDRRVRLPLRQAAPLRSAQQPPAFQCSRMENV